MVAVHEKISPRQLEVIEWAETSERVLGCFGSIRGGKTHVTPISFGIHTQRLGKPYNHAITGRSLRQIELEILPHFERFALSSGLPYHYNRGKKVCTIGTQQYICMAANDKSSSAGLIGLTFHSALADESPLYPEAFLDDLFGRLSFQGSKLFLLGNPQGPKHYIKERWIDGGIVDTYLKFELYDNPKLHDDVIAAYEKAYSGVFYRRNILGEWSAADGLIWPTRLLHVPQIPTKAKVRIGVDVGFAFSRTAFTVLIQLGPDWWHVRKVFLMDSAFTSASGEAPRLSDLMAATERLVNQFGGKKNVVLDIDSASVGVAYYQECIELGYRVARADKWTVIEGLQRVDELLTSQKLTIDEEDCEELLDDMASYSWKEGKDEPDYSDGTYDTCDGLRYGTLGAFGRRNVGIQQVRI